MLMVLGQFYHWLAYGNIFSYGYQVEVAKSSIWDNRSGRAATVYACWLSNHTIHPLSLEVIMKRLDVSPFEYMPEAFHSRVDKWDAAAHAWMTVRESGLASDTVGLYGYSVGVVRLRPFESGKGIGVVPALTEGLKNGDTIRFVFLTSCTRHEGDPGVQVLYSNPIVIRE